MFTRKLLFGADYYPEHWDKSLWKRDVALMKRAGFNLVRLAEFAWTCFEPKEGQFDFDWLEEPLDLLSAAGIQIILGTPTATVPAWLAERFHGLDHDPVTRKLIAASVAAEQVLDLVDRGVTNFHFYTMNRADLVFAVCHLLGLRPTVDAAA